jgi:hypothetical protein
MAIPYARRIDTIDDSPSVNITTIYKGEAAIGSTEADSVWRISRTRIDDNTDGDVIEVWADGSAAFVNSWDNRASLSYS